MLTSMLLNEPQKQRIEMQQRRPELKEQETINARQAMELKASKERETAMKDNIRASAQPPRADDDRRARRFKVQAAFK